MAISKRSELIDAYPTLRGMEQEDVRSIDRRNIEDVNEIYTQDDPKEQDHLYEDMDDAPMQPPVYKQYVEVSERDEQPQDYDDAMNSQRDHVDDTRKQAPNEFRI
jgi:hypothetical protein